MEIISLSEKLMYNTVKIKTKDGSGTGFFFCFTIDQKEYLILITNKHVINNDPSQLVSVQFHISNGNQIPDSNFDIPLMFNRWYFHSSKDLCFCFINQYIERFNSLNNKKIYISSLNKNYIYTEEQLMGLSALEELTMVGYPIGLSDEKNNFPIFRKGFTASHPGISFNDNGIGLADIAAFPGSSGSPIFVLNENSYNTKDGTVNIGDRCILLGILYGGPQININGKFEIKNIPTSQQKLSVQTPIMTNLGYYICAYELLEFENQIKEIIKRENE